MKPPLCLRAYGAVYKATHKESGQELAIKQVPVDSDLQDIIKEISIMQQCDRCVCVTLSLAKSITMTVQSVCGQVLWELLQEHRPMDSDGILWGWLCLRYHAHHQPPSKHTTLI